MLDGLKESTAQANRFYKMVSSVFSYDNQLKLYIDKEQTTIQFHLYLYDFSSVSSASVFSRGEPLIPSSKALQEQLLEEMGVLNYLSDEEYLQLISDKELVTEILTKERIEHKKIDIVKAIEDEKMIVAALTAQKNGESNILKKYPNHGKRVWNRVLSKSMLSKYVFEKIIDVEKMVAEAIDYVKAKMQEIVINEKEAEEGIFDYCEPIAPYYKNSPKTKKIEAPQIYKVQARNTLPAQITLRRQ